MLITVASAIEAVLRRVAPLPAAVMTLDDALGCYLAEDVRADRDQPPTARSTMDGYAVRAQDTRGRGAVLRLVGEVAAGSIPPRRVAPGTCVLIMTGATLPSGADAVVKIEDAPRDGGHIRFRAPARKGANIRAQGEDASKGEVVLPRGAFLAAPQTALTASVGRRAVKVHRRPRVAIVVTGDEVLGAGSRVRPHQIRDSNGPALRAALRGSGLTAAAGAIVRDSLPALVASLAAAADSSDIILVTGGVSVGKYDFVPAAAGRLGARTVFHGVSMKPGKPAFYATLKGNRHLFGLPGNPLSVLNGFHNLAVPALRRLSGCPVDDCIRRLRLPLARSFRAAREERTEFVLARLLWKDGPAVIPIASRTSADIASSALADGAFAVAPGDGRRSRGDMVDFTPWASIP